MKRRLCSCSEDRQEIIGCMHFHALSCTLVHERVAGSTRGVPEEYQRSTTSRPQTPPSAREKGLVTVERFLGSCKLSILVFAQANQIAALRFSCDIASCCAATLHNVSCLVLALTNQNVAVRFCILLRSNVHTDA